jgi:hypothetical protein
MSNEVSKIQKSSWFFVCLALFTISVILLDVPTLGPFDETTMLWASLIAGMVAGLGGIHCVLYLIRRRLTVPVISIAAAVVGGVTLSGSVFMIAWILYLRATCYGVFPMQC